MATKFNDAFWRWFGDSKVVDKSGEPLIVYHGTDAEFYTFSKKYVGSNFGLDKVGFFFSDNWDTANRSRNTYPKKYKFAFTDEDKRNASGGRVLQCYLRIENPLTYVDIDGWQGASGMSAVALYDYNRDVIERALSEGESIFGVPDGFILKSGGGKIFVALEPNQIKVVDNDGTWDLDDDDIRSNPRRIRR